jgi:hypothetical protein
VSINVDASYRIYVLIHTINVEFQSTMTVNIRNQCSGFELRDIGHFSDGAYKDKYISQKADAVSIYVYGFTPFLTAFESSIMGELMRKHVESDDRSELISTLLLVGWKSEGYKKFRAFVQLIEFDRAFRWYNFQLQEYYQKCANQLNTYTGPIKDTWLMHDGTVLTTTLELDFTKRDGALNITISEQSEREEEEKNYEGIEDDHIERLAWIGPRR